MNEIKITLDERQLQMLIRGNAVILDDGVSHVKVTINLEKISQKKLLDIITNP